MPPPSPALPVVALGPKEALEVMEALATVDVVQDVEQATVSGVNR